MELNNKNFSWSSISMFIGDKEITIKGVEFPSTIESEKIEFGDGKNSITYTIKITDNLSHKIKSLTEYINYCRNYKTGQPKPSKFFKFLQSIFN